MRHHKIAQYPPARTSSGARLTKNIGSVRLKRTRQRARPRNTPKAQRREDCSSALNNVRMIQRMAADTERSEQQRSAEREGSACVRESWLGREVRWLWSEQKQQMEPLLLLQHHSFILAIIAIEEFYANQEKQREVEH